MARRNFLEELIGKQSAKQRIEDVEEAANELDAKRIERKAKRAKEETAEKQEPLVAAEVIAEAIVKALGDAGVELGEDTIKLIITTAMEAAAKIEQAAPEPVAEIVEEEAPMPEEEMQADEEEEAPPAPEDEEKVWVPPDDEEEKEKARQVTEKALTGFADMITDVKEIGVSQMELSDAVKSLAEIVKELLERTEEVEKVQNAKPRLASQDDSTEIKGKGSRKLKKEMEKSVSGAQEKFLDIPLSK